MELTPNDVREVRFGTTRFRAGYNMGEVDEFLDRVEAAIAEASARTQQMKDEAGALRSQLQQLQGRLEAANRDLAAAQEAATSVVNSRSGSGSEHDTVIVHESAGAVVVAAVDGESTAENPIVVAQADPASPLLAELRRVRDNIRSMLQEQLEQVDRIEVPSSASVAGDAQSQG